MMCLSTDKLPVITELALLTILTRIFLHDIVFMSNGCGLG